MNAIGWKARRVAAALLCALASAAAAQEASLGPFWDAREADVAGDPAAAPVRIGIWDSGVDLALFPAQVALDAQGAPLVRGYDAFKRRQDTPMAVLPDEVRSRQDELNGILRALDDRDGGVDSAAARGISARMKAQTPAEADAFDDVTGRWSGYVHGTAIADIALRGLPGAQIVVARQQWWHGRPPVPCWTRELADREAASIGDLLDFLVANGARVVNMSWGRAERAYLGNLKACAPQMPDAERAVLARYTVERIRTVLQDGMRAAPQVLFVGAAGNAGASLQDENPATRFSLPNFLMVGAVDRNGAATDWTNTGTEISLFASGDRVPARMPGGSASFPSGTSMAAPLVANAAAKMLAVAPDLDGARMRELLERTATPNATGQRLLHPRDAVEAARTEAAAGHARAAR
jgi:subtilisin family serine protease